MRDLLAALAELRERLKDIPQADERRLSGLKTEMLGRKAGALTHILARLPKLEPSSKKEVGAAANALKREFEAAFDARERDLKRAAGAVTGVDLTMPARAGWRGGLHLVTQVVDEICEIFRELGFTRAVGRGRDRTVQLLRPQLPQGSSGARRPGLVLFERGHPAAHPYLARADPHPRALPTAHPGRDPGAGVPSRPVRCLARPGVPADRRTRRRRGDHVRGFQGDPGDFRAQVLRPGHAGAVPALVLPVHRAVGRDGRAVSDLQGCGVPHVQADRLDGNPRLGARAPYGARELRRGQRALHRLRVGHGSRAHCDEPPRDSGHPSADGERRAIPRAVRGRSALIVSRRWLEALLDRPLDPRDVADRLTLHVAAVDAVVPLHQDLGDVLIARVLEVKKHPDADRLSLCLVDRGGGSAGGGRGGPVEVVCGAPNVQAGKIYPYAPVGAVLPGGVKLERKKIRGVESNGMLCSAKELGLGADHTGILELDTTAAPGTRFIDAMGIGDHQIVIDVPANRPDLLCHKGVARELGSSIGAVVKLPAIPGGPADSRTAGPSARPPATDRESF